MRTFNSFAKFVLATQVWRRSTAFSGHRPASTSRDRLLSNFASSAAASSISAAAGSMVEEQAVVTPLAATSRVLVVGASRGIGMGFVEQLLDKGCEVLATYRGSPAPALEKLQERGNLTLLEMDVGDAASIASAADRLAESGVTLTHIIHNAGVLGEGSRSDPFQEDRDPQNVKDNLMRVFEINTVGPFLVARHFRQLLKAEDPHVPIIAILSSKVGSVDDNGSGGLYAYRASKSACNMIAKSLYVDLKRENTATVVVLHPGYVRTDMTSNEGFIDVPESVGGMLKAVEATGPETPFRFVDYKAELIPW